MKNLKIKIFILLAMSIFLSCQALPFNYSAYQSWLTGNTRDKTWTTVTVLGVQIDRSGGWDSIEREAASLAPLYFWDRGCRVVSAEEGPQYAARIWIRERDFTLGWNSKKSLAVEVHIWPYENALVGDAPSGDAPSGAASYKNYKLPIAVGRVVMTGDASFSSSDVTGKLLSRAITRAVRRLAAYKDKKDA